MVENHSEFFWLKVKRFSEFNFTAKVWRFKLKKPFRMAGEDKNSSRHFFCQKNGERRRTCHGAARRAKTQVFSSLCEAQLHSKGAAFSSLPRRNAMKPGHLHKTPEKPCLPVHRSFMWRWMKSLISFACLSRRNLQGRWRRMKLPPVGGWMCYLLLRFAYTAALPFWIFCHLARHLVDHADRVDQMDSKKQSCPYCPFGLSGPFGPL